MGIDFTKTKVPYTSWISLSSLCEAMKLHFMKVVKTRFITQACSQSWAMFWQLLYLQQWPLTGMFMGRILCVQQQSLLFPVRSKQRGSGQAIFHSFTMWLNCAEKNYFLCHGTEIKAAFQILLRVIQSIEMPDFMVSGVVSRVYKITGGMLVKSQRNVFLIKNFFAIVHQGTQDTVTCHLLQSLLTPTMQENCMHLPVAFQSPATWTCFSRLSCHFRKMELTVI